MAATVRQQVNAFRDTLAAKQDMDAWLEDTWADVKETEHVASLLVEVLEYQLDANRAGGASERHVTLRVQRDDVERTIWMVSRVWSSLKDLDERVLARLNQTEPPASPAEQVPVAPPTLNLVSTVDELREALDRIDVVFALVKQLPKGEQTVFERTLGDVHDLVCNVHNKVDAEHKRGTP